MDRVAPENLVRPGFHLVFSRIAVGGNMNRTDLLKHFLYHEDGKLLRVKDGVTPKQLQDCGYISNQGYVRLKLKGTEYSEHRLVYMYHFGEMPEEIDHINGNKQTIELRT